MLVMMKRTLKVGKSLVRMLGGYSCNQSSGERKREGRRERREGEKGGKRGGRKREGRKRRREDTGG